MKQRVGREKPRHILIRDEDTYSKDCPKLSADHTSGIPRVQAPMLHLSNVPKLNARPGMVQYSPGITEGAHLHPSLPKGLPFSPISLSQPVISGDTWTSLAVLPPAICLDSFFLLPTCLSSPTGTFGKEANSPSLVHTSIFPSHPALTHTSSSPLQKSILNYTPPSHLSLLPVHLLLRIKRNPCV